MPTKSRVHLFQRKCLMDGRNPQNKNKIEQMPWKNKEQTEAYFKDQSAI